MYMHLHRYASMLSVSHPRTHTAWNMWSASHITYIHDTSDAYTIHIQIYMYYAYTYITHITYTCNTHTQVTHIHVTHIHVTHTHVTPHVQYHGIWARTT